MATYDNSYAIKITPNNPNLRGLTTNYSGDGQKNLGGVGLGDLFELDYDRNEIEKIFNQGTDAAYAVKQKENQIAQNQYANNQFANQQSAVEALRQQRNSQIASGMARGLNAAQEQGTILGIQQEGAAGALELANERQIMADEIAAEYAKNVISAMQESNAVKQAMANVSSALYEADMLGYTGELSAAAQMDANASTRYAADRDYEGSLAQAAATRAAAKTNADATIEAARIAAADKGVNYDALKESNTNNGVVSWTSMHADLVGQGMSSAEATAVLDKDVNYHFLNNTAEWEAAIDGNNSKMRDLGITIDGGYKGFFSDSSIRKAIKDVQADVRSGKVTYNSNQDISKAVIKRMAKNDGIFAIGW